MIRGQESKENAFCRAEDRQYQPVDARQVQHLCGECSNRTDGMRDERHLTRRIAKGFGKMIEGFKAWTTRLSPRNLDGIESKADRELIPPNMIYDMVDAYGFDLANISLDPYNDRLCCSWCVEG
jgi:hypothetical protein